jgi:anti-sigma factor (TIGR02949 family)
MSERACEETRLLLLDHLRGQLAPDEARRVREHLASCSDCTRALEEERVLSELLQTRLSAAPAPESLRRTLTEQLTRGLAAGAASRPSPPTAASYVHSAPTTASGPRLSRRALSGGLWSLSLAAAIGLGFFMRAPQSPRGLEREALNDHLRLLYAQSPVEIPNGGLHQVKPWFTGRVDFAPDIVFAGDEEFPLLGGAIGYFVDRKAASFLFKRRLHTISLFVFRSEGFEWPRGGTRAVGAARVQLTSLDGFHLAFWQAQGLGHVLVSDVSEGELLRLAARLLP